MRYYFAGVFAALAAAGCGGLGAGENPTNIVSVKGRVVGADGRPLKHVDVGFSPAERGLTSAYGTAGADGTFTVRCLDKQDGMVPGRYKVTVTPLRKAGAPKLDPKFAEEAATPLTTEVRGATTDLVIEVK